MRLRGTYLWLALLSLCLVFAATTGVREALATRTSALRQTLAAASVLSPPVIVVSGQARPISAALSQAAGQAVPPSLSEQRLSEFDSELYSDLNKGAVSLAPASADWTALTTNLIGLSPSPPAVGGLPVRLEIGARQPLGPHVRLTAGAFPGPPAPSARQLLPFGRTFYPVMQILVSQRTAARFGWTVGSRFTLPGPSDPYNGTALSVTLVVSGIVAPVAPGSSFWTSDPTTITPDLVTPPNRSAYWAGALLAVPAEAAALQSDFGSAEISVQWSFPLDLAGIVGQQARPLNDALTGFAREEIPLSADLAPAADQLSMQSGLSSVLTPFLSAAQSADALLWLLYVSLTVAGLVVLLLSGRMVVLRGSAEFTLLRARGASLWQLAGLAGGQAALCCVPAAVAGSALALAVVPGPGGLQPPGAIGAWWPVAAVLLFAIGGPAVMAAWRHRLSRRRGLAQRSDRRSLVRPVAEVTLILASAGGAVVLRQQGLQAGSGVNLFTSAVPALIAIPAVTVVFRLYPLVLRGLLHAAARTSGAPGFLGLARAARAALTPALPAFALVLALSVAAFGGMVSDAIASGEVASSWAAVGADATITASPTSPNFTIPQATVQAIAGVPGVTHAARVWQATWTTSSGTQVVGLAVDPAQYAALVAATEGYPAIRAGVLAAPASPGAAQPVIASPAAAAAFGTGAVTLSTQAAVRPVKVRIAATVSSTPALPTAAVLGNQLPPSADSSFVIMPFTAVKSSATPPEAVTVSEMLLTGSGIDRAALAAALGKDASGGKVTYRADVLTALQNQPLQHGAVTMITLSVAAAALLGLAVMLLGLALSAADRDAVLARLATLGLGGGQRARVVGLELLPAVVAAAVAAWACALALPPVLGPVIDLSAFTGSSTATLAPDVATIGLPLIGLLVLAALSLGVEIEAGRRRGVASALRIDG